MLACCPSSNEWGTLRQQWGKKAAKKGNSWSRKPWIRVFSNRSYCNVLIEYGNNFFLLACSIRLDNSLKQTITSWRLYKSLSKSESLNWLLGLSSLIYKIYNWKRLRQKAKHLDFFFICRSKQHYVQQKMHFPLQLKAYEIANILYSLLMLRTKQSVPVYKFLASYV